MQQITTTTSSARRGLINNNKSSQIKTPTRSVIEVTGLTPNYIKSIDFCLVVNGLKQRKNNNLTREIGVEEPSFLLSTLQSLFWSVNKKMGSLNNAHHESTGGVVIFNGELILLFCDSVHCEVDGLGSVSNNLISKL